MELTLSASSTLTITYTYDALNRLTAADYSDGSFFHYAYDSAGNRLSETTQAESNVYTYDDANRLTSANGVAYAWDANGNLLSDGVNTYTYDGANRLTGVTDGVSAVSYAYNGLGDRLQTSAAGQTTRYTLDLVSGLTQVLEDGGYTYLYGNGRIAQYGVNGGEYFLGDALGSVRQLVDGAGDVTLTQSYTPYGKILDSSGEAETSYAFTGEQFDKYTGLVYLRARWYAPYLNQFIQPDTIIPDPYNTLDWNRYAYARSNPLKYVDPTGHIPGPPPFCPFGCTIWDYSDVGGSGFGGRLLRALISTGTELVDFLLINGATQTDPKACTWNLAGAEDRFIAGTIPPMLLGVTGGRQLPLPGFEDILRTQVSGKLSGAARNSFRNEARKIFYEAYPRLSGQGLDVHHRIPLEWAHMFPDANPNRLSNLIGLDKTIHTQVNAMWSDFRFFYERLGRSPTVMEILEFAYKIDQEFSTSYNKVMK
jgi:RHS repeat-associated protein